MWNRKFFRRKPKNWGVVHITPYMTMGLEGDTPQDIRDICTRISRKLSEYEDIMAAYGRAITSPRGYLQLQQIQAAYDTFTGNISIMGSGTRFFSWDGKLEDFLNNGAWAGVDTSVSVISRLSPKLPRIDD